VDGLALRDDCSSSAHGLASHLGHFAAGFLRYSLLEGVITRKPAAKWPRWLANPWADEEQSSLIKFGTAS
jgi:hypothetical protein